ncbi:MAG: secretion system protein, partial [Candidatus Dormibacteraeota bacterium]|nr:secretion system protein [Candidatus Dormibacteraeota bacterium]
MSPVVFALEAVGALAIFVAIAVAGMRRTKSRESELDARVQRFAEAGAGMVINMPQQSDDGAAEAPSGPLATLRARLGRRTESAGNAAQRARNANLAEALARADVKLRPAEWYLIRLGSVVILALIGFAVYRNAIFALILAVIGVFAPPLVLRFRERRRSRRFNDQLGDVLTLLSNGLKAGYSFPQAMGSIARSANPPVAEEFSRATREVQLGVATDDALTHMVTRIRSEDLDLVVTAVQIQRVVGGNLAEILDNIAFTIRERVRIKGEIRTLTAQARASSYIITALPVGLALILQAINPSYIGPLLSFK